MTRPFSILLRSLVCVILAVNAGYAAAEARKSTDTNLMLNPNFTMYLSGKPVGWHVWSPRAGLSLRATVVDSSRGRALSLESRRFADFGKWATVVPSIKAGAVYRFEVLYQPRQVQRDDGSVAVILSWWADDRGALPVQRDYVDRITQVNGWRRASRTLKAPEKSRSLKVELGLRWTNGGVVLWKDPRLVEVDPPRPRVVRVVTTHVVPPSPTTIEDNLKLMAQILDQAGKTKPDLVVLSECLLEEGVSLPMTETAQTIPGPATAMLGGKAKQYGTYLVTSLHERDGALIYNSAVLIDRKGRVVGKYRKTHLPMTEGEDGISPGSDYPTFQTDFGKIGIMICWDSWFTEPARILRLKGAELLVLPLEGDGDERHWDVMSRARAVDNGVYLVASSTVAKSPSRIIDPDGDVMAETLDRFGIVASSINLDRESRLRWLSVGPAEGEARSLYIKERRPDTYSALTRGSRR